VAAGECPPEPDFVNDAAKEDWDKWANAELPKAEARLAAAKAAKAAKAAEKAAKAEEEAEAAEAALAA